MGHLFRVACLVLLSFPFNQPARAQECTPDTTVSLKQFKTAYDAIFFHQGFAWGCSAYIGEDRARFGVVPIEGLLRDSGLGLDEAKVRADEINMKAKAAAERDGTAETIQRAKASRHEVINACSQLMDEEFQKYRVARAKMRLALCQ
ncbi:hypothetical protein ACLJYM_02310 [Rhizobium giardinii]|uniref:hypothetical protein n=1 Tax=Rhizobium giardinii TaxID=56731 RepID=UPI0039DF92AE